ncbi:MAG: RluA family pseudouridine synthase [Erysipelotrichia bacterium]|nr:RluA family pseudouridine synthase [Erysipelotrichia bacterium]
MEAKRYEVTSEEQLTRLDKFINALESDLSRSRIQTLIEEGHVFVNQKVAKANYKVKMNDVVEIEAVEEECLTALPEKMDLDIVYEDKDVIVINKPKGIVVHPAPGALTHTLVNGLLYHCKDLSGINGVLRPGIVHRIDKDTTGLLIVAKNDKAHLSLSEQLQSKSVSRKYYALVHGVIEHEFGTIDAPIGRDVNDRQKMAVTATNSKDAITHFKVVERFREYTLVECKLETGRTHQIRVHMQYIKHPVVGDEKYSYKKTMKVNGQLLHAHELRFIHPTSHQEVVVQAPLPALFEEVLETLREKEK